MAAGSTALRIDYIADVVCPWCYLGWNLLKTALARRPHVETEVIWRAYQLDPTLPEGGISREDYHAARRMDPERARAAGETLNALAKDAGLPLKLADMGRWPNTAAAHALIRAARSAGCQDAMIDTLMRAYFAEGRDIGDLDVLCALAEEAGLGCLNALEALSHPDALAAVGREHAEAAEAEVTAVPVAIFGGRFSVVGAQSPERLLLAIDKLTKLAASEAASGGD